MTAPRVTGAEIVRLVLDPIHTGRSIRVEAKLAALVDAVAAWCEYAADGDAERIEDAYRALVEEAKQ